MEAGATASVEVRLTCADGCDLRGAVIELTTPQGEHGTCEVGWVEDPREGAQGANARFVVTAPASTGEAEWTVRFPTQSVSGVPHEEHALVLESTVVPHATSMAIWDVPSPLQGTEFAVRVGVKCATCCVLAGQVVQVLDEAGVVVGEGRLGAAPLAGTDALYETLVALRAPERPGMGSRRVICVPGDLALPHHGSSGTFTFRSLPPPEHTVTVRIVPEGTEASMADIEVRLGDYRAHTDLNGVARVGVPRGSHELSAWRVDIEPISSRLDVSGDAAVEVVAVPRRVVDEDAERWG